MREGEEKKKKKRRLHQPVTRKLSHEVGISSQCVVNLNGLGLQHEYSLL